MGRNILGLVLFLCGLAVLSMAATGPAVTPAYAGPALQPSPRPTLIPTPDRRGDDYNYPDPAPMGRITGTVIDLRTGAPMAGKRVVVGGVELTTDANGNYDTWVAAGQYPVSLGISSAEGVIAQDVTTATVWGNDTVVVHLFFTSAAPVLAAAPAVTPVAAPTAPPLALPSGAPVSTGETVPASLPVTGETMFDPQSAALGGLALLALGGTLMLLPRRAPVRVSANAARALRRRKSAEDLLRELLRRDV